MEADDPRFNQRPRHHHHQQQQHSLQQHPLLQRHQPSQERPQRPRQRLCQRHGGHFVEVHPRQQKVSQHRKNVQQRHFVDWTFSNTCRALREYAFCVFIIFSGLVFSGAECRMRFLVHPSNASVAEQVDFVFNCTITELDGDVQWTKGGFGLGIDRELEGFERYSMVGSERRGEYNLLIRNVSIDDEDRYECQVSTSNRYPQGLRSSPVYLTVVVNPERVYIVREAAVETVAVIVNKPTNIICRAEKGKPAAHISWHLNGERITNGVHTTTEPNGKYLNTISVLTFNATLTDTSKKVECQAMTEFMHSPMKDKAILEVQYPPTLQLKTNISERNIKEHDYVSFECSGNAHPSLVVYKWYFNDKPIPDSNFKFHHIQDISPDYNGKKISCEATNSVGTTRIDKLLNVEFGPRIESLTEVVGADLGGTAVLTCEVRGNPEPSIIWRRKDRVTHASRTLVTKSTFHISNVTNHTFGWYVCIGSVIGFPDTSREVMLLKNDKPDMKSEKQQMGTEGERGKLECIAQSIPKPISIVWSKGGKPIHYPSSGRFSKEDKDLTYGVKSTLHIHGIKNEDFGYFNCTVENNYGIATEQIELVEKHILPITYIIIGIIGGLALIFVTALVCVLYRKCKKEDQGSVLDLTKKTSSEFGGSENVLPAPGLTNHSNTTNSPRLLLSTSEKLKGSYTDTDSSSEKKREKADSPHTLMGQFRQEYRFSADYDDMPYKTANVEGKNDNHSLLAWATCRRWRQECQVKGNNNGYGFIEPCETYSDNQIYDGEYVRRGEDLVPDRLDPMYSSSTGYSMSSFRGNYYETTPPPTMTRLTPLHMSNNKLATDV
ncbi:irregular chiasm C-roughest protein-like isoform X2 [Physella acuta]|uniref:irregular chiasm C-roughest protein-like isoform X2 n=1 Tax=Physella acuta TaxID=109671 RepID=UPI0027DE1557|nr:irregular chiasm C-roughest protein-like isoform X2 [Physella acuta]